MKKWTFNHIYALFDTINMNQISAFISTKDFKHIPSLAFTILILAVGTQAQFYTDALKPFYGYSSGHPVASALGHATVAAGQVLPDIGSNPANIAMHRFRNFSLGYGNGEFKGNTSTMTQDGLNNLQIIFPIPVYQGSLVAAAGYNRDHDYGLTYEETDFSVRDEGRMSSWYAALALEYMKNLYIGLNISRLRGYNDYLEIDSETTYLVQPTYRGWKLGLGVVQRVNPYLNIGFSVDFPSTVSVTEDYTESTPEWNDVWSYEYQVSQAPVLRAGAAFFVKWFNLFYETKYTNWSNLTFSSDIVDDNGLDTDIGLNAEIESSLSPTLSHHIGAALHLPFLPLHIYSGYQYEPNPDDHSLASARETYSAGFSYLFQQQLSLNYSLQQIQWTYDGSPESWLQSSLSLSLHF